MNPPSSSIILDATPLDSNHRHRGIGRYVSGLMTGFTTLRDRGELDADLRVLRLAKRPTGAVESVFPEIAYRRIANTHARDMFLENRLRLDAVLPDEGVVYHATSMEGISQRKKLVSTCHDLIPLILQGEYLRRTALAERMFWNEYVRVLRGKTARVVAISEHVKRTLVERYQVSEHKIDVVYHGLAPFWSQPADESKKSSAVPNLQAKSYVLFVGGFDQRKGFDRAIQAVKAIPERIRPELVVVGRRGKVQKKKHAALLRRYRAEATFLGKVTDEDLRLLYSQSLCLLFPSIEEGWGFPIVEAMAAGTPVVCADFGSMAEAAGGAAMTANVRSIEDLSHAIRVLIADGSVRRRLVDAGKQRVKHLSWADNARTLLRVYEVASREAS